jgi:hypothetical protein
MTTLAYGLVATPTDQGLEISGQTFQSKDRLKEMGAKWNAQKKLWVLPSGTDLSGLALPPRPPQPKLQKVFRTYICGYKKAQLDPRDPQGPMIWVCDCCGTYKSDYSGT